MKRIDTATKAVDLFGEGKHGYKDGNPLSGDAPTQLNAAQFNHLQEEIANVIELTGGTLDPADYTQLYKAILRVVASVDISGRFLRIVAFPAAGTWPYTRSPDCRGGLVDVVGAGGPGGGAIAATNGGVGGGGGGEGGRAQKYFSQLPETATVIVGAGGVPGAVTNGGTVTGTPGGSSSFNGVSATGGGSGQTGYTNSGYSGGIGGLGGMGSGGDMNFKGGDGTAGNAFSQSGMSTPGGNGGGPHGGRGSNGAPSASAPGGQGSGGGGGGSNAVGSASVASKGGDGYVIIFEMS